MTPIHPDDAEAHLAGEDAELVRWLTGGLGTLSGTRMYFQYCQEEWAVDGPLRGFGIRVAGLLAGTLDLRFAGEHLEAGEVNVAYGLYPTWRGQGHATRAVRLAADYAARVGAKRAVIKVEPENGASCAVAARAGFEPGGTVVEHGEVLRLYFRDLG
ncbi:GNAT family N-acetyltransferase [Amycolatopsis benzoatilytica]|uniref:GNAT family N-acetyltransferase n=1 Tax=Amycolatopsis benzoatilytica TaxID=346045 RepID=UPI001FE197F2|nr:GNAT family N-acetyltransferase [Amycolatopsis benzoatilytica]